MDADGRVQEWIAYRLCCRKCPSSYESLVPGSVWLTWDRDFTDALPLPVLKWEFDRQVERFDKEQRN